MLKFYHAPLSRGSTILWLLEEIGEPYEIVEMDIRADGGADEAYRAIQPNKKVPAIEHAGTVITERAAIAIYLAEAFPQAGLAPAPGNADRAAFLTWTVYADSVLDPCVSARAHGLTYGSNDYSFGLFDDLVANLERRLTESAFIAGPRFSAADVQVASSVNFTMNILKVLPERPVFKDYLSRTYDRPASKRAQQIDMERARRLPYFQEMFAGNQ